jgi:hypothetical protein
MTNGIWRTVGYHGMMDTIAKHHHYLYHVVGVYCTMYVSIAVVLYCRQHHLGVYLLIRPVETTIPVILSQRVPQRIPSLAVVLVRTTEWYLCSLMHTMVPCTTTTPTRSHYHLYHGYHLSG